LRILPLAGGSSMSPSNVLSLKVPNPIFWWILYGPSQSFWKFICLPFISFVLSHLRTISPSWKSLYPTDYLSNHILISSWCWTRFILSLSLSSSSFRSMFNLCYINKHSFNWIEWMICNEGKNVWVGKIASYP